MKKPSSKMIVSFGLLILYASTYVISLLTQGNITVSSVILCIGALIAYMLFLRWLKPLYYYGILGFTFFAQYLGAMLHLYSIIPYYDKILHLLSGVLLVFLADYLYSLLAQKSPDANIPTNIRMGFVFLFSVAAAAVWEIWEYAGDTLLKLTSQGGLDDTMGDIIAGSIGAIIGVTILIISMKKSKTKK